VAGLQRGTCVKPELMCRLWHKTSWQVRVQASCWRISGTLQPIIEATLLPFDRPSVRRKKLTFASGNATTAWVLSKRTLDPGFLDDRCNEFGERVRWDRRVHHDEVYDPHQHRNGRNISQEVERKPRIERGFYGACGRDHEQPVPSGCEPMTVWAAMLPAAPALFPTTKGCRSDSVSHCATIRATMSDPAGRLRPRTASSARRTRVGAVITTGFTVPDTRCGPRRRSFSDTHFKQSCRRAPVCRGRRMACTLYALLAYRIGSYIPVPGIDPAASERGMALEDRSVLS
jgi:hypothetical protein